MGVVFFVGAGVGGIVVGEGVGAHEALAPPEIVQYFPEGQPTKA